VVSNSWPNSYIGPPDGKLAKCELRDSKGTLAPWAKGIPLDAQLQSRIAVDALPRWHPGGGLRNRLGFLTNSPPAIIAEFKLRDVFRIEKEDDYGLTICPSIYKFETNGQYVVRLDLPCVSMRLHVKPSDLSKGGF
jgi:hypothetical protein